MRIAAGPLEGYEIIGEIKPGKNIRVLTPAGKNYPIEIKSDGQVLCTCPQFTYRGAKCKHAIFVSTKVPEVKRIPRVQVEPLIRLVLSRLSPAIEQAEVVGSYRREKPDVKDVDILIIGDPKQALQIAEQFADDIVMSGDFIIRFHHRDVLFDLTFTNKKEWGACLLYRTGSKQFNIKTRAVAKKKGLRLNEHGLFEGEKCLASETEEEILRELGFVWVEPRDR